MSKAKFILRYCRAKKSARALFTTTSRAKAEKRAEKIAHKTKKDVCGYVVKEDKQFGVYGRPRTYRP